VPRQRPPSGRCRSEQEQHEDEEREVHRDLLPEFQRARQHVCVQVTGQQRELEEHRGGGPHSGSAAEEGQRHPGVEGLDPEEERGGEQQRGAVEP
jgi:hypothetical protein